MSLAIRGLRDLRPPPPSSAITRTLICARFTSWLVCPPEQAGDRALQLDIRLRGLPVWPHQTSLGCVRVATTGASAGRPPHARPTRCPLSASSLQEGEIFTALFNSWEREGSDPGHTACNGRTGTPAHALGHPPTRQSRPLAQQHLLGPGASLSGHTGVVTSLELGPGGLPPRGAKGLPHPGLGIVTITQRSSSWTLFLFLFFLNN